MTTDDERQMKHIMQHVFRYLIFQSDVGLDYMEKFKAWRRVSNKNIKIYSNIYCNIFLIHMFSNLIK